MIAVVMTYFERQAQLIRTLQTMEKSEAEFDVIIVDDSSQEDIQLPELSFIPTIIKTTDKHWTNPEPAYNTGLIEAMKRNPDIIILQNAECYHVGDVMKYAERVTDDTYISFGCFSVDEDNTRSWTLPLNKIGAFRDGQNAWYNHPEYRPVGYDFCSAMTARNMKLLNGYDERFSAGCGYGDNYLLHRIHNLGLKIEITETPFVVHQWHYSLPETPNKKALVEKNKKLFWSLAEDKTVKAVHLITEDL